MRVFKCIAVSVLSSTLRNHSISSGTQTPLIFMYHVDSQTSEPFFTCAQHPSCSLSVADTRVGGPPIASPWHRAT